VLTRWLLLVALVAVVAGCSMGVAPTIGYRSGSFVYGGEVGPGAHVVRGRVGASIRDGEWYKFWSVGAWFPVVENYGSGPTVHGALGKGMVEAGAGYFRTDLCNDTCWTAIYFAELGVRHGGGVFEIFLRPSVEVAYIPR
jgi:hypothetical protein